MNTLGVQLRPSWCVILRICFCVWTQNSTKGWFSIGGKCHDHAIDVWECVVSEQQHAIWIQKISISTISHWWSINQRSINQQSVVITLFDLKNAFGMVHHNLIKSVLDYHHVPNHIKAIIQDLYTDFKTSIITHNFNTPFITVGRGQWCENYQKKVTSKITITSPKK